MEIIKTRRDKASVPFAYLSDGLTFLDAAYNLCLSHTGNLAEFYRVITDRGEYDPAIEYGTRVDSGEGVPIYVTMRHTLDGILRIKTDGRLIVFNSDCRQMFYYDGQGPWVSGLIVDLTAVPVSFARVTDAREMFANSPVAQILVPAGTALPSGAQSTDMFTGCTALVGGSGTAYDASHTDGTYARVDDPPSAPGYFTAV